MMTTAAIQWRFPIVLRAAVWSRADRPGEWGPWGVTAGRYKSNIPKRRLFQEIWYSCVAWARSWHLSRNRFIIRTRALLRHVKSARVETALREFITDAEARLEKLDEHT
jgi:hypothetical protein